jgi:hypothetical protein
MKNLRNHIGNQPRDISACSAVIIQKKPSLKWGKIKKQGNSENYVRICFHVPWKTAIGTVLKDLKFGNLYKVSKQVILCGIRKGRKRTRRTEEEALLLVLSVKQRTKAANHSFFQ